jgi:hypothetical protein
MRDNDILTAMRRMGIGKEEMTSTASGGVARTSAVATVSRTTSVALEHTGVERITSGWQGAATGLDSCCLGAAPEPERYFLAKRLRGIEIE